jgi:hypothetical protein
VNLHRLLPYSAGFTSVPPPNMISLVSASGSLTISIVALKSSSTPSQCLAKTTFFFGVLFSTLAFTGAFFYK